FNSMTELALVLHQDRGHSRHRRHPSAMPDKEWPMEIPATWMRGGTSKCWVFRRDDLDVPGMSVDEVLLRAFGSPDHRQVDGVGGGTSTTSKAVILSPSDQPDVDVDYTFAQVG